MTKKLLAINNETGERIEFDLIEIKDWESLLRDYTLYYLHEGIYYNYETGKEMV